MLRLPSRNNDGDEWRRARVRDTLLELRRGASGREVRTFRREIRAAGSRSISGYALLFDQKANISGLFWESVRPGAFTRTLSSGQDVKALLNHDPSLIVARKQNGTLSLREDSRGLAFTANVNATSHGNDLLVMLKRGDLSECSYAFTVPPGGDDWTTAPDGRDWRIIRDCDLYDVSVVAHPAGVGTTVQADRDILDGEDEPCACDDPDCDDPECVERSRMIPGRMPERPQLELRSRIARATMSDAEWLERARAKCALTILESLDI